MTLREDIQKAKEELKEKARREGMWENFGQKKVRELKGKYDYAAYGFTEMNRLIDRFEEWCMNYTPHRKSITEDLI